MSDFVDAALGRANPDRYAGPEADLAILDQHILLDGNERVLGSDIVVRLRSLGFGGKCVIFTSLSPDTDEFNDIGTTPGLDGISNKGDVEFPRLLQRIMTASVPASDASKTDVINATIDDTEVSSELVGLVSKLAARLSRGEDTAACAHTLKGTAALAGAAELRDLVRDFESRPSSAIVSAMQASARAMLDLVPQLPSRIAGATIEPAEGARDTVTPCVARPATKSVRVLIADDSTVTHKLLSRTLLWHVDPSWKIKGAHSAAQTLAMATRRRYQLIFLDTHFNGEKLTGPDIAKMIREHESANSIEEGAVIVSCSGDNRPGETIPVGVDASWGKPFPNATDGTMKAQLVGLLRSRGHACSDVRSLGPVVPTSLTGAVHTECDTEFSDA